jgi:hypothetical protein
MRKADFLGKNEQLKLPPPQAIQPVMSMPVRRLKFEIWDEALRSCKAGFSLQAYRTETYQKRF